MGRSWEAVLEASTINPELLVERVKRIRKVSILCFPAYTLESEN
jgi:hypothetical protein